MQLARWLMVTAAATTVACQEHPEQSLTPAQKKKVEAHLLDQAPTPQIPIGAVIEDQVRLIGVDVDKKKVKPGESVTVTYYIEPLKDKLGDNMPFVHFQGRKNDARAWMNLDHHPVEGLHMLREAKKGKIIKDVQTFTVKPDFPGGEAKIYWGLFRGDHRLKITNADQVPHDDEGRVIAATIEIDAPQAKPAVLPLATATRLPAGEQLTIDGKLDEPAWERAQWTGWWVSPDGKDGPAPRTRARFLWDEGHLYVGVESQDDDVWGTFTERDSNTWEQEVIELFIDADGDQKDYLELQVTPNNVVFDARFEKHRSDLAKARAWNMEGLRTGAHVDGTVNQREDTDQGWTVELAVPVAQVPGAPAPVAHGQTWRVNLFRWDAPKTGGQKAAAFSPPIVGDFHALDRFGRLRFVDPAEAAKHVPVLPEGQQVLTPKIEKLEPKDIRKVEVE